MSTSDPGSVCLALVPAVTEGGNVEVFGLEAARPLIGTEGFSDTVMALCVNAAQQASTQTEALRCQRLARGVGRMLTDPFAAHTVGNLAKAAGMSRSSFAQCFTNTFGRSPLDYLKAERLRLAAHLVRTTSLPLKLIAGRIGYGSVSYFSRAFRKQFNVAPSAVRGRAEANGTLPAGSAGDLTRQQRSADGHGHVMDRFRLICDATNDVMWDIDLATGQVWWSEGMLSVFGYGPEQVGSDTTWCHAHIHPQDRQRVTDGMRRACAGRDVLWRDQFRYRKADGQYAYVVDRGLIVRDAVGKAVRFVGAMHDISAYLAAGELPQNDDGANLTIGSDRKQARQ